MICQWPAKYRDCQKDANSILVCADGKHISTCYYHAPIAQAANEGSRLYHLSILKTSDRFCSQGPCFYEFREVLYSLELCKAWCNNGHPVDFERVKSFLETQWGKMQRRYEAAKVRAEQRRIEDERQKSQGKLF